MGRNLEYELTKTAPTTEVAETAFTTDYSTAVDYPDPFTVELTDEQARQIKFNRRVDFDKNVANPFEALLWAKKHRAEVTVTMQDGTVHDGLPSMNPKTCNVLLSADGATVFDWLQIKDVEVSF